MPGSLRKECRASINGAEEMAATEAQRDAIMAVVADITAERRRQIDAEGWTAEHDDTHSCNEMAEAAACYANPAPYGVRPDRIPPPRAWPWSPEWWKPRDRRRNLVRAAALLVAEIERLDRAKASSETHTCPDWDGLDIRPGDVEIEACLCDGPNMGGAACGCGHVRREHFRGRGACKEDCTCLEFNLAVQAK